MPQKKAKYPSEKLHHAIHSGDRVRLLEAIETELGGDFNALNDLHWSYEDEIVATLHGDPSMHICSWKSEAHPMETCQLKPPPPRTYSGLDRRWGPDVQDYEE